MTVNYSQPGLFKKQVIVKLTISANTDGGGLDLATAGPAVLKPHSGRHP